jgi:hypothetical protein
LLFLFVFLSLASAADKPDGNRTVWSDPGDIRSKDLLNGPGGEENRPKFPVKFVAEDSKGHSSKLDVEDASGKKWKAKLGLEAQAEVAANRFLWAVGYFVNENYFVHDLEVQGLPAKLHRGQGHVTAPNHVENVRLQRHFDKGKESGNWSWRYNKLKGTREFNGLRVMMALISNWDLKDENNAIYKDDDGKERYMVTDLGTSFGASGDRWTEAAGKNNLGEYKKTKFVTNVTDKHVSFSFPRFPPFLYVFDLPHFYHQARLRWIGNDVPREDVKWIGGLLGQLSSKQIEDAFRAAGYAPAQVEGFSKAVEARIAELNRL